MVPYCCVLFRIVSLLCVSLLNIHFKNIFISPFSSFSVSKQYEENSAEKTEPVITKIYLWQGGISPPQIAPAYERQDGSIPPPRKKEVQKRKKYRFLDDLIRKIGTF